MTDKQQSFVDHYCTDAAFNASKAFIMAGYSKVGARQNASQLITKDYIRQAITKKKADLAVEIDITAEFVVNGLREIAVNTQKTQPAVSVRAYEQLGRHLGIYEKDNDQKRLTIVDIMAIVGIGGQDV